MLLNSRTCIVIDQIAFTATKMKIGGFLLMLSGWAIVLTALALLRGTAVSAFVIAGLAVEIVGLVVVARAHLPLAEDHG
jgi:hypothetical protein